MNAASMLPGIPEPRTPAGVLEPRAPAAVLEPSTPAAVPERRIPAAPGLAPLRFAALGDSFTEGVGDPVPGGRRGWAALLAESVPDARRGVEFRNFAVSGAQSGDVLERQAAAAAAFRPHLASVVVGVNDTLRRTFDIRLLARRLDEVCALLTQSGAVLLTACLPDPGAVLGLPAPLGRPLARRQGAVNAVVHALSERYDAVHLHMADQTWVGDRSLWSADRLHPAEHGHRTVAAGFHELLAARGLALGPAPGLEPQQPPPSRADTWLWLATAGTGWLARRSTDLLPQLLCLAASEVRHRVCGTDERLDRQAEAALRSALDAVRPAGAPSAPPVVPHTGERTVASGPLSVPRVSMEG